jgi:hypothetical protein
MKQHLKLLIFGIALMLSSTVATNWDGFAWAVLLFVGMGIAIVWIYFIYIEGHVYYINAQETTRYVRLAELISGNPNIQHTLELSMRASLRVWPQLGKGPIRFLADTDVPLGFVAEFLNKSDNTYPASTGKFSDGEKWKEGDMEFGETRYLAGQVLDYFEQLDWIKRPQGGPNGIRWSRTDIHPGMIRIALEIPANKMENS